MISLLNKPSKFAACSVVLSFFAASTLAFAQDAAPPAPDTQAPPQTQEEPAPPATHGWPKAEQSNPYPNQSAGQVQSFPNQEPPPPPQAGYPQPGTYPQGPAPASQGGNPYPMPQQQPGYGPYPGPGPNYGGGNYGPGQYAPPAPPPVPAQLTIAPGTYVTVRINQLLSSEHNRQGDAFTASLVQPVVVNGVVVAEPGETLGGQVAEVQQSGRVKGVARLGVTLTDLALVDGQRIPVKTQLIARKANSTVGRDAGAIAGTTALGAAIGAAANWGTGAAVGAGAGLILGTIGVLVTKGAPSIISPEQVLTFRIEAPVEVSTVNAPQAFHWVMPGEYDRPAYDQAPGPRLAYAPAPGPYVYGYPYPYYSPFWYGPSLGFYFGRGYGYGFYRGYYHGGYFGGHFRR